MADHPKMPPNTTYQKAMPLVQLRVLPIILILFVLLIYTILLYNRFTTFYPPKLDPNVIIRATLSSSSLPFTDIKASFYTNSKSSLNGTFDITSISIPIFKLSFPVMAFNPDPNVQHCSESTGVNTETRPFTDVLQNRDGSCRTIPTQDDHKHMAGHGNLYSFEAVFLTSVIVPSKGTLTMQIRADDGWIISIGANSKGDKLPTPEQTNIMAHPPIGNKSPIYTYPEMGDNNQPSSPTPFTIIVNFPTAGTYPVEIDYTECCGSSLTLVVSNVFTPVLS